jgi:hypothetical protein
LDEVLTIQYFIVDQYYLSCEWRLSIYHKKKVRGGHHVWWRPQKKVWYGHGEKKRQGSLAIAFYAPLLAVMLVVA